MPDAAMIRALGPRQTPPGLRLRRQVRTARIAAPALAGGLVSFWLGGLDPGAAARGLVLAISISAVAALLRDFPYPLRGIPVSRMLLALTAPLAGAFVAGILAVSNAYNLAADGLIPATVAAALAAIAVELLGDLAITRRPLRIAVLDSPEFAAGVRGELEAGGGRREAEVVGWLNLGGRFSAKSDGLQIGTVDMLRAVITEHEIDLLVRGTGAGTNASDKRVFDSVAEACLELPVRMIDGNQLYEQLFGHVPMGTIDSAWFLFLMHPNFKGTSRGSKRVVDVALASVAALFALPLVLLAAIAIKVGDGGSMFYRQRRVGEGGGYFEILKLRTMQEDAESAGAQWSLAADDRVTRVGRVLRRLHIDELPQIVNVLRGDMTLVGPRPERPEIIAELERAFPHYKRRLLVKPGVTGWAQVRCGYAGSEVGTAWKLCHDLYYLKHRSLVADLLIMAETVAIAARDSHRPLRSPKPEFLVNTRALADAIVVRGAGAPLLGDIYGPGKVPAPVPELALGPNRA